MAGQHGDRLGRRDLLRSIGASTTVAALAAAAVATPADPAEIQRTAARTDPHTAATFAALVDTVVPATPAVADDLGSEHASGGLAVGLDAFLVTYVNTLFQFATPGVGHVDDGRLAEPVAGLLDEGATELLARDMNEHPPGRYAPAGEDWTSGGPFARLHRADRVRAIALFDEAEKELRTASLPGPVAEADAGVVGQLVVAFTEVIYYSEWAGYPAGNGLTAPPSERRHPNSQAAVQSWRQTGYPRVADGYKALRGYAGRPDSSLGAGEVWTTIPTPDGPPLQITLESGHFTENAYDTSGYEEVVEPADREALPPLGDPGAGADTDGATPDRADPTDGDG